MQLDLDDLRALANPAKAMATAAKEEAEAAAAHLIGRRGK